MGRGGWARIGNVGLRYANPTYETRNTKRLSMNSMDELPAFPEGWYFVTSRASILREKLIEKTWLGEEIVVWCDEAGRVCVADAVCPHLGSYLGPEVGGRVCNGRLVCPFHGFEYDTTGQCVATPNAPAPRAAQLKVYETGEILGMVFAWFGSGGRPPQWDLPDDPPTGADWGELGFRTLRFRCHPQETAENSVDLGHLRHVHGYENVNPVGSVTVDGAYLKSCFDFKRVRRILGVKDLAYEISAVTHIYGLAPLHLLGRVEPEVGMTRPLSREFGHAEHLGFQRRTHGVEQGGQRRIV